MLIRGESHVQGRQATEKDVVQIRDVATKAWFNTYLNIYAATTVNHLLEASYNEHHLKKRLQEQLFLVVEEGNDIVGFANLFTVKNYIYQLIMLNQNRNIQVMVQHC